MSASLSEALQKLANYRSKNSRESLRVFELGAPLLSNDKWMKQKGDGADSYTWLEQLALAAIDVGRTGVADKCIEILSAKFPESPRVDCLAGIYIEATESPEAALRYYQNLLEKDESNAAAWKRQISALRHLGKLDVAVDELSKFLDTYYTDLEGWLELADIYSTCGRYDHALESLQHAMLLAPQNPFYVLQAAETGYTLGDLPLAIKFFMTVVDMTTSDEEEKAGDSVPDGITLRAWFGVKQCTRGLLQDVRGTAYSNTKSRVSPPTAAHLALLDELSTERLLTAYSTSTSSTAKGICGRDALVRWLEGK
ncbi:TPR-like protein [Schizopora paradoxa]|uniref:ER membrane protein complex subunit 2 n=1 Tax=Schizopora paradoxa TaxID=27342 RepID=A0A0H2R8W6_9AGAM|nr:TPR-like protein [Schizopora paradoxa]